MWDNMHQKHGVTERKRMTRWCRKYWDASESADEASHVNKDSDLRLMSNTVMPMQEDHGK
jgi:hypothetical protein